jgi:hypothetical protein
VRVWGPSSGEERPPLDDKFAASHWLSQPCHPEAAESSASPRTSNEGPVQLAGTGAAADEYIGPSSRKVRGIQDDKLSGLGRPFGAGVGWFMLRLFHLDSIAVCAMRYAVVEIPIDAGGGACGYGVLRRAKSALLWMTGTRRPSHSLSQPCHSEAAESSASPRTPNEGPVQLAGTCAAGGEYRGPSSRKGCGIQDDNLSSSGRSFGAGVGWFMLGLFRF